MFLSATRSFRQRAARPFGEHRDLGPQFVARREIVFGLSVLIAAFVFRNHARDGLAFVDQLAPANCVNTFTPACSTSPPSHFTSLLTKRCNSRGFARAAA